jgi:prophage DNA circulation protein
MDTPGLGILVHPHDGNVTVYPIEYTLNETNQKIGMAEFTLVFAEAQESFSPSITSNVAAIIGEFYRNLYDLVDDAINLEYTMEFVRNVEDSVQVTQRIINKLRALYRIAVSFEDGRDSFRRSIDNYERAQYRVNQSPQDLGNDLPTLIGDFDNLTEDADARFDFNRQAFGLGFDDDNNFIEPLTPKIVERNKNRKLLNGTYNYLILVNLYNNVSSLEFDDEEELENTANTLDTFYLQLINCTSCFLTNDLLTELNKMRNKVRRYFDNLRLTVAKLTTIEVSATPAAVLSYKLYGSSDNYQEILDLNNWTNPARIEGSVKVLEQ